MSKTSVLAASMESLREHRAAAQKELERLGKRHSALQADRDSLMRQGVSREDYAEVVLADIDRVADECQARMTRNFSFRASPGDRYTHTWPARFDMVLPVIENKGSARQRKYPYAQPLQLSQGAMQSADGFLEMETAFFLFREQIKDATRKAILAVEDWPFEATMTLAEMRARLAEIDAELGELDTSMREIRAALESSARAA